MSSELYSMLQKAESWSSQFSPADYSKVNFQAQEAALNAIAKELEEHINKMIRDGAHEVAIEWRNLPGNGLRSEDPVGKVGRFYVTAKRTKPDAD